MYFEQIPAWFTLFFMVYGGTALVALLAFIIFLLWRVDTLPLLESTPAEPQPPIELVGLLKQEQVSQQLAIDSGYRNYGTFNHAFKQRMGQSVTVWMRNKG